MENEVIYIDKPNASDKPVEFTHILIGYSGWVSTSFEPFRCKKVVYLGKCSLDGDIFACYEDDCIDIYKGHLNSGRY